MWTSQGCGPSTRITLSAWAVTEERSEFITLTGSPRISPSWFSQSAGYFSRRERVSASNSLDIRSHVAHEVSIKIRSDIGGHPRFPGTREWVAPSAPPTDWLQLVNQPQTEAGVAALRCCVAASIAIGPSAILTGSRTRPSDWGSNARFGPVEDRRNNRRLVTFTCTLCSTSAFHR